MIFFAYLCNQRVVIMDIINLFDKDVTLNAVLYILAGMGGEADMHKVFKTLYFADQRHLSKYGRTITGDVYIAMRYGPVPSKTDDIFKSVRGDSYFQPGDLEGYFHFVNRWLVKNDKAADMDYLSDTDVECLDAAISLCKDKSFDELTMLSHGMAYANTAKDSRMSYADILMEVGDTDDYARYITDKLELESSFK